MRSAVCLFVVVCVAPFGCGGDGGHSRVWKLGYRVAQGGAAQSMYDCANAAHGASGHGAIKYHEQGEFYLGCVAAVTNR